MLTDPTGVHLGAGPYLLFYSRHMSDEEMKAPVAWPELFAVRTFLVALYFNLIAFCLRFSKGWKKLIGRS